MSSERYSDQFDTPIYLNPTVEVEVELRCNECGDSLGGINDSTSRGWCEIKVEFCRSCRKDLIDERLLPQIKVLHAIWYQQKGETGYTSFLHPEVSGDDQELMRDWNLLSYEAQQFLYETPYLIDRIRVP